MHSDAPKVVDWANLPDDVRTIRLWSTLHDGDLITVQSDVLARPLTLQFDVPYVREYNHLTEDSRFILSLSGVKSVRAVRSEPWPGDFSVPKGSSREEESRLVAEYQSKWREESQSWKDFEKLPSRRAEVSDAILAFGNSNAVALKLVVLLADGSVSEAFISAEAITFSVGDRQLELEAFLSLGNSYWDAFANRIPN